MARIIEACCKNSRRMIKMSSEDVLSIVMDYQRIVPRNSNKKEALDHLENTVIYIPED